MINNEQNNVNSLLSQFFLLASIDFPLMSKLDISSLLALACNRKMYEKIQNYLLQHRSVAALKYQKSRVIKSLIDLQSLSNDRDITPFQTLKQTTLNESKIEKWLGREDLTTEMRFYGLLYSTRFQKYSLELEKKDNQILEKLLIHLKKNTIEFEIILPYLLPHVSEENQGKWLDELVTDNTSLRKKIKILTIFLTHTSLPSNKFFSSYEKIYTNYIEGGNIIHFREFLLFSKSLFSKLPSEKIQKLFIQSIRVLMGNDSLIKAIQQDTDLELAESVDNHTFFDSRYNACEAAFKILAILIPYLEPQQIRDVLQLTAQLRHGEGSLRNAADQTLTALAPYLPLKEIEKIIDRNLNLTEDKDADVWRIANQTISILCPHLPSGKILEVFNSTLNLIDKLHLQYKTGGVETFRLATLLPHLQTHQVEEVILGTLALLNDKVVVISEYLIRRVKYQLLSLLLFHMNSNQVKEIVMQGLLWFKEGDEAIYEIEKESLKKRLSDLSDEQIQEIFEIIVKDSTEGRSQTILYLDSYILSVFLPNLRVNQIEILYRRIIKNITADDQPACTKALKSLTHFLDYLPAGEPQKVFKLILQLVQDDQTHKVVYNYAFSLIEALLPRVQIQSELPSLLALAQTENESIPERRMAFLGSLAYHLPPNEIKKCLRLAIELRKGEKDIKLAGYKILHAAATQLQSDEIRELLPEIQTFLKAEYEKWNVQNSKKPKPYQVKIVVKLFSTLSQFLPQLSQDEIISVLPPIEALWNNQAGDTRAIALANFIEKVIPLIKYETISDESFLNHPLLFLMKIMHDCKEKIAVKPNESVSYSNSGQSLFSQPRSLPIKRLIDRGLEQEPENKPTV